MCDDLEKEIRRLTAPINGQLPRPWMTTMSQPCHARVFVVGRNQATSYPESIGYERHIDALFNRNGETCQRLYKELRNGSPGRGRRNIERFAAALGAHGVDPVLETNVVCYATTGSAKGLNLLKHKGGRERGLELFGTLVRKIRPRAMVVHGSGACEEFNEIFVPKAILPKPPEDEHQIRRTEICEFGGAPLPHPITVFVIRSLTGPGYSNWARWAPPYLDKIAQMVAEVPGVL